MSVPYTVTIQSGATTFDYIEGTTIDLEPAAVPMLQLVLLRSDAAALAQDDQVIVTIVDNYDSENITTVWLFYAEDFQDSGYTTTVTCYGSEMWLARRLVRSEQGPDDVGVIVKQYVDDHATPITSGGVDIATGTNAKHDADYTTLLQLLDELRQQGFRSFVKYIDGGTPEELQFFKESTALKAATRELAYGA